MLVGRLYERCYSFFKHEIRASPTLDCITFVLLKSRRTPVTEIPCLYAIPVLHAQALPPSALRAPVGTLGGTETNTHHAHFWIALHRIIMAALPPRKAATVSSVIWSCRLRNPVKCLHWWRKNEYVVVFMGMERGLKPLASKGAGQRLCVIATRVQRGILTAD